MIKNLSQLKKRLTAGSEFEIIDHCRQEYIGQTRRIILANTQGFYSIVPEEPDNRVSLGNGGKGSVLWWSKAPFWKFENGVCSLYDNDKLDRKGLIIAFQIMEKEAA